MTSMQLAETVVVDGTDMALRVYRHGSRVTYLAAGLSSDRADYVYDLVTQPGALPMSRVGFGSSSNIYRVGDLALKQFNTELSGRPMAALHGRIENLQASMRLSRALRDHPQAGDGWQLRGIDYWGACIDDRQPGSERWAMDYIDGINLLRAVNRGEEVPKVDNQTPVVKAQYTAMEQAGMDYSRLFMDNRLPNFMVTNASLASMDSGQPLDIVRVDIGIH